MYPQWTQFNFLEHILEHFLSDQCRLDQPQVWTSWWSQALPPSSNPEHSTAWSRESLRSQPIVWVLWRLIRFVNFNSSYVYAHFLPSDQPFYPDWTNRTFWVKNYKYLAFPHQQKELWDYSADMLLCATNGNCCLLHVSLTCCFGKNFTWDKSRAILTPVLTTQHCLQRSIYMFRKHRKWTCSSLLFGNVY